MSTTDIIAEFESGDIELNEAISMDSTFSDESAWMKRKTF